MCITDHFYLRIFVHIVEVQHRRHGVFVGIYTRQRQHRHVRQIPVGGFHHALRRLGEAGEAVVGVVLLRQMDSGVTILDGDGLHMVAHDARHGKIQHRFRLSFYICVLPPIDPGGRMPAVEPAVLHADGMRLHAHGQKVQLDALADPPNLQLFPVLPFFQLEHGHALLGVGREQPQPVVLHQHLPHIFRHVHPLDNCVVCIQCHHFRLPDAHQPRVVFCKGKIVHLREYRLDGDGLCDFPVPVHVPQLVRLSEIHAILVHQRRVRDRGQLVRYGHRIHHRPVFVQPDQIEANHRLCLAVYDLPIVGRVSHIHRQKAVVRGEQVIVSPLGNGGIDAGQDIRVVNIFLLTGRKQQTQQETGKK